MYKGVGANGVGANGVGANGVGANGIRPYDTIEVIRFLCVSPIRVGRE
jgi:hypothetical protein